MANLRPAGRMRPAEQFHPARDHILKNKKLKKKEL
jgi:hypothetical protein